MEGRKMKTELTVLAKSHHRNGVCGDPFDVYIFKDKEAGIMVGIDFGKSAFAMLNIEKLAAGDIAFGSNSWRGDRFADDVREAAKDIDDSFAPGSLFVRYEIPE
jgi:hypothetical protein